MKKSLYLLILGYILFFTQNTFAWLTLWTNIPVVGTATWLPASIWNAGDVTFNWYSTNFVQDPDEPYVNASSDNTGNNAKFYGNFWLENVWWATFNFWDESSRAKLQTINATKLLMTGFAWSENAGWIAFDWNGGNIGTADDGSVYYDKTTRSLKGYAWNENLGFIPMNGIQFDIVWPVLDAGLTKPFAADDSKIITVSGSTTSGDVLTINIDKWDAGTFNVSNWANHDFRKAKNYNYIITDQSGNQLSWIFDVVANIPSVTLNINNIWWWVTATTYTHDMSGNKIADAKATHSFNIKLRDTYGNEVKPETWIKDVRVNLTFTNDVDRNQIINSNLWNAIIYTNNDFWLTYWMSSNTWVASTTDGIYDLEVASQAPTTDWYSQTTSNNDIYISDLSYTVTALWGNSWIWEISTTQINTSYIPRWVTNKLNFTPAIYVSSATNSDNWTIIQWNETETTYTVIENKTTGSDSMTDIKVKNSLDMISGNNYFMSFQDVSIDGNDHCYWYNSSTYQSNHWDCSAYNPKSILINKLPNFVTSGIPTSLNRTLKSTPKIILISPTKLDYDYDTSIEYDLGTTSGIAYNSYKKSVSWGSWVTNSQIKILWQTNETKNIVNFVSGSTYNSIWNLSKSELKTELIKNAYWVIKNGVDTNSIKLYNGNTTLTSWPTGKDTIIVNGGNLYLENDISKSTGIVKAIIVTKKADKTWGNIFVKNNVQKINAVLIAEWWLISGTSSAYYADANNGAVDQLYIYGSLFSNNTVWGSSKATPSCPFDVTSGCNLQKAKRYDLNHFRHYINGVAGAKVPGLAWYDEFPMIIKYDSDIALWKNKFLLTK